MNLLGVLNYAYATIRYTCMPVLVLYFVITHTVFTFYFWANGVKFPILCMLPFGRLYAYRQMAGTAIWLCVLYILLGALALLGQVVILGISCVFLVIVEWGYAQVNVDKWPVLYALCPFYKYYYCMQEAVGFIKRDEKEVTE